MRHSKLLLLLPLAVAAPVAAQGFEGTVTYRMAGSEMGQAGDMTMKTMIKGDQSATVMTMTAGPMGPTEMHMLHDGKTGISTILMPMPAGMGGGMAAMNGGVEPKGMKIVMNPTQATGNQAADKSTIKKLGTSQTVAGLPCDDYEITPEKGGVTRMCITTAIGAFAMPSGGMGRGGRGGASPAWVRMMPAGSFPLKIWTQDGKVAMEVTSITRGAVSPSEFVVPEGYMAMPGMGGRMGGGGF